MSRSFSNTLLFESALDAIGSSNTLLYSISQALFHPQLLVVEDKCNTLLGLDMPVSSRAIGCYELVADAYISDSRITSLITSGNTYTAIRSIDTCISQGGICKTCYLASRPNESVPAIGTMVKYSPEIILDIIPVYTSGITPAVSLTYDDTQFDKLYVFDGATILVPGTDYTVSGQVLTLTGALSARSLTIKYIVYSNISFYNWLCKTYSGSLLGVKALYDMRLPVRKELLEEAIPIEDLEVLMRELRTSEVGGEDPVLYLDYISDPVERAIFAIILAAIYLN